MPLDPHLTAGEKPHERGAGLFTFNEITPVGVSAVVSRARERVVSLPRLEDHISVVADRPVPAGATKLGFEYSYNVGRTGGDEMIMRLDDASGLAGEHIAAHKCD